MALRNAFDELATELTIKGILQRLQGTLSVAVSNFPATQATDVLDRAGRLLGRVTVDNFPAVQSTDVTDRSARLLGRTQLVETATGRLVRVDDAGAVLTASAPRRTTTATPPTLVTVRSYATVIVPANPNRLSLLLQNIGSESSDDVFVGYGFNPTTSNGIRIRYTGDRLVESNYTGAIHAIASQTTYLRYLEVSL